jgi:hypothetical protein
MWECGEERLGGEGGEVAQNGGDTWVFTSARRCLLFRSEGHGGIS